MLAYAAQGLATDQGSQKGRQLRDFLGRAARALSGLAGSSATAIREEGIERGKLMEFLVVLDRDARDSIAAMELVLDQPGIVSQLDDNLNASIHLRAVLLLRVIFCWPLLPGSKLTNSASTHKLPRSGLCWVAAIQHRRAALTPMVYLKREDARNSAQRPGRRWPWRKRHDGQRSKVNLSHRRPRLNPRRLNES